MNKNWIKLLVLIVAIAISVAVYMRDPDPSLNKLLPYVFGIFGGLLVAFAANKSRQSKADKNNKDDKQV